MLPCRSPCSSFRLSSLTREWARSRTTTGSRPRRLRASGRRRREHLDVAPRLEYVAGDGLGDRGRLRRGVRRRAAARHEHGGHVGEDGGHGAGDGVGRSGRQTAQYGHQAQRGGGLALEQEQVGGEQRGGGPGGLHERGPGPEVAQQMAGLLDERGHAGVAGLYVPQSGEHRGARHHRGRVVPGEGQAQRVQQVVLFGADRIEVEEGVRIGHGRVPGEAELPCPGEELPGHLLRLAGLGAAVGAELPHGLQHAEPNADRRVHDLEQRLVDEVLEHLGTAHEMLRRLRRESVGEDGQGAQGPLPGPVEEVPAPVDDGEQRAVPFGRVPGTAAQQGEPVVEAADDLGYGQDTDAGRGQFRGEGQPVEAAAQLLDGAGRELDAPGPPAPAARTARPWSRGSTRGAGGPLRNSGRAGRGWW